MIKKYSVIILENAVITTDDLIPLMIYVIIKVTKEKEFMTT